MRILLLTADYPPDIWSGIGTAVSAQAAALARAGHAVHILVASRGRRRLPAPVENVTVERLSDRRCSINPAAFDLIHLHSLALSELGLQMKRRFGVRLVYTAHSLLPAELEARDGPIRNFWSAVQAHVMRYSDHVVFLNEDERRVTLRAMPALRGASTVIPNGISPALAPQTRRVSRTVLFVGRFTRAKGVFVLYEVVPRVLRQSDARFIFAGGHGEAAAEDALQDLVRRYPERCQKQPWLRRQALDRLLASAALVLIPSLYEPFGLVALEAMRLATPVLAATVGGLKETIAPEAGGELVGSHDPDAWATPVVELINAPRVRATLGSRGPGYVATYYNEERWAARLATEAYG